MQQPSDVVFVSRQRLVGRTNGSSAYLLDLAAAVSRAGMTSSLVQPSDSLFGRMPVLRFRPEMKTFSSVHVRGGLRLGDYLISLNPSIWIAAARGVVAKFARRIGFGFTWLKDRKAPYSIAVPWTMADRAYAARYITDSSIVIADYIFQTEAFGVGRDKPRATATIMHDLFHRRAEMVAATGQNDSVTSVSREDEVRMLGLADLVIAIQQAEADFVRTSLPSQRVMTVPMSFAAVPAAQIGQDDEILFVGSNTEPNVAGLKWFFENCWPGIVEAVPQATLTVAGSVSGALTDFPAPQSVKYLGVVDDLAPLYSHAGLIISPLTFGSGLKVKLIEAMALGKAIVATSVTLQGVQATCESAIAKADSPEEFASAVIALVRDKALRAELGKRSIAVATEHFSATSAQGAFTEWLIQQSTSNRNRRIAGEVVAVPEHAEPTA